MKQNSFLSYLTSRNKLSFQNIRTGEEYWHVFANRLHLIGIITVFTLTTLAIAVALVTYTAIIDYIPGNPGAKQRQLLIENIVKLDSMNNEIELWDKYNKNVMLVLEGLDPNIEYTQNITKDQSLNAKIMARSNFDSLLRLKHKGDTNFLQTNTNVHREQITFKVIPPSPGMIVEQFNPIKGQLGIKITPPAEQTIVAALDGTVILNTWSPENGTTITIQHPANITSIYKNLEMAACKPGDKIRAGETIGKATAIINGKTPEIQFELWLNGAPLNPQMHITF